MAFLGPLEYSVNGGTEIDILERHKNENNERVVAAIVYARDRLKSYSAIERKRLSDALVAIKFDYLYLQMSIDGASRLDNPGPLASSLLQDI